MKKFEFIEKFKEILKNESKLQAVKFVKTVTGMGLKESVDHINTNSIDKIYSNLNDLSKKNIKKYKINSNKDV